MTRHEIIQKMVKYYESHIDEWNQIARDYLEAVCDYDNIWYPMDNFNDFLCGAEPLDIVKNIDWHSFNPYDDFFKCGIYGYESSNTEDYDFYLCNSDMDEILTLFEADEITLWNEPSEIANQYFEEKEKAEAEEA